MERRKFIELNAWLMGLSTLAGGSLLTFESCSRQGRSSESQLLGEAEKEFLNELAEIIIPTTDTPGGKAADPGAYIVLIHNDCLSDDQQNENKQLFDRLRFFYVEQSGKDFMRCSNEEREHMTQKLESDKDEAYTRYKQLIVSAFLSSKTGASLFMKFNLIPGRYDGCTSERPW